MRTKILLTVIIILVVILLNGKSYLFNMKYYDAEFKKLGIYEVFQEDQALEQLDNLIDYLKENKPLTTSFFNEKEKQHLYDVQRLIQKGISLFYLLLFFCAAFLYINRKELSYVLIYAGISLILLPFIFFLINFESAFLFFHNIAFNNDLWILNPETDNLIKLFPEQFFYDIARTIGRNIIIMGSLLTILGFIVKKFSSKRTIDF